MQESENSEDNGTGYAILDFNAFAGNLPIQMGNNGGSYSYEEVQVTDLEEPMTFTIPYYGDGPIEDAACAYFDEEEDTYKPLECSSPQHNIGINNFEGKFM